MTSREESVGARGGLHLSAGTRRILDGMDDAQERRARRSYAAVRRQRRRTLRLAGAPAGDAGGGRPSRRGQRGEDDDADDGASDDGSFNFEDEGDGEDEQADEDENENENENENEYKDEDEDEDEDDDEDEDEDIKHKQKMLMRRTASVSGRRRRGAVVSRHWKSLSSMPAPVVSVVPEDEGRVKNWWKKVTASFDSFGSQGLAGAAGRTSGKKPPPDGAACFRRGRRAADRCLYLKANALYNLALIRQREELGEDHLDCATTLNEIGLCFLMMGELYPAMSALEEALYIRENGLEPGAPELAETTDNIWIVLHEESMGSQDVLEGYDEEEE